MDSNENISRERHALSSLGRLKTEFVDRVSVHHMHHSMIHTPVTTEGIVIALEKILRSPLGSWRNSFLWVNLQELLHTVYAFTLMRDEDVSLWVVCWVTQKAAYFVWRFFSTSWWSKSQKSSLSASCIRRASVFQQYPSYCTYERAL